MSRDALPPSRRSAVSGTRGHSFNLPGTCRLAQPNAASFGVYVLYATAPGSQTNVWCSGPNCDMSSMTAHINALQRGFRLPKPVPFRLQISPRINVTQPAGSHRPLDRFATAAPVTAAPCFPKDIRFQRLHSGNGTTSSDEVITTHQVLLSSPSATSGALPEALSNTFPDRFPTLSAARRGARRN